jgi:hypothetical protein
MQIGKVMLIVVCLLGAGSFTVRALQAEEFTNSAGLNNTHTGVREWCLDWYGEYPAAEQVDPVGPEHGMAKVVRGGLLDDGGRNEQREIFNSSSSRASIAPGFGPYYNDSPANRPAKKETVEEEKPEEARHQVFQGLIGTKYGNKAMKSTKDQLKLDTLNKVWTGGDNDWAVQWFGYIEAPHTGEITFYAEADDGMRYRCLGRRCTAEGQDEYGQGQKVPYRSELLQGRRRFLSESVLELGRQAERNCPYRGNVVHERGS